MPELRHQTRMWARLHLWYCPNETNQSSCKKHMANIKITLMSARVWIIFSWLSKSGWLHTWKSETGLKSFIKTEMKVLQTDMLETINTISTEQLRVGLKNWPLTSRLSCVTKLDGGHTIRSQTLNETHFHFTHFYHWSLSKLPRYMLTLLKRNLAEPSKHQQSDSQTGHRHKGI